MWRRVSSVCHALVHPSQRTLGLKAWIQVLPVTLGSMAVGQVHEEDTNPHLRVRRTPVGECHRATDCPWAALSCPVLNGLGWLLDTQVQPVGLFSSLQTLNGPAPNGTQHNMEWQICTVTADLWLAHQNASFRAGAHPSSWGGPGFVKTKGSCLYCICGIWFRGPSTYLIPGTSQNSGILKL